MKIERDAVSGAIYIRMRLGIIDHGPDRLPEGTVDDTLELDEGVYVDLDREGYVVGIEFVGIEDFTEFLAKHPGGVDIPDRIEDAADFHLDPVK